MQIDLEFDLLMYFLTHKMQLGLAVAWVSQAQDTGHAVVEWEGTRHTVVKEFDNGGYPFYTVTTEAVEGE